MSTRDPTNPFAPSDNPGWLDAASPLREQIAGAIRAFTSATTTEAGEATLAILKIVQRQQPQRGIRLMTETERSAAGMDPNGGFDGPTGAD